MRLINISLFIMFICSNTAFAETVMYQYKDKDGTLVTSNTLPPEVANQGYKIVSTRGNVIEVVPPRETEEQIKQNQLKEQAKLAKEKEQLLKKKEQELQAKKDEALLKIFESIQDIERSRDEKIASINVLEGITQNNIKRLQEQLDNAKKTAENFKSNGTVIPKNIAETIQNSENQIKNNLDFLKRKDAEKKLIIEKHAQIIERFKRIQADKKAEASSIKTSN